MRAEIAARDAASPVDAMADRARCALPDRRATVIEQSSEPGRNRDRGNHVDP